MRQPNRLMSAQFSAELNAAVSEYAGQYVVAYATAPGALMGAKIEDTDEPGVEEIVELSTFGQALAADGTAMYEPSEGQEGGEPQLMVTIVRQFIPKSAIPELISFLERAYGASASGLWSPKEGENGQSGPPDRN